jgi:hypothetical protein
MSNHLRHCPKHRKPLPCVHCALTAKPAQAPSPVAVAVLEPESALVTPAVKVPPITVIPPHEADAKPVPPSAISPDIRKKIAESLASKPNVISDQRTTVLVADTSDGTKTIRATGDVDSAVDGAAEKVVRKSKTKQKKDNDRLLVTPTPKKQPAYLKSVAQPIVPSADPKAPYGRDENDRPIGVPVGKTYIKPVQTGTIESRPALCNCNHQMCRYCHPENIARTTVLADITNIYDRLEIKSAVSEATLRRQFGLPEFTSASKSTKTHEFIYYPALLGLSRTKLIELIDAPVEMTTETEIDSAQPKQKILKPQAPIKAQLAELKSKRSRAETRITELTKSIRESRSIIEGLSVRVMKLRRNPEDIIDKPTREKFKREENQKLEEYEKEKRDLQKQLRDSESDVSLLQNRLDNWGTNPDDFIEKAVTREKQVPLFLFSDKFIPPDDFKGMLPSGYGYGVPAYRQWVYQYDVDNQTNVKSRIWQGWKQFENEIVLQAIGWGLIRPSKPLLKAHPSLGQYLNGIPVDDESEQDDPENALILKTGGAQVGGSIYSGGHRNMRQRPLESFDKRKPPRGPGEPLEYGGDRPDNFYSDIDSGDLGDRPGDE